MNRISTYLLTVLAIFLLAACSSTPKRIDVLEDARITIDEVESHPRAEQVAGDELADAREALRTAENLQAGDGTYDDIYHEAYLALRHAEIARERVAEAVTREQIEDSEAERTRILLIAREAEAEQARKTAEQSEREAAVARSVAEVRQLEAEQARDLAAAHAAEAERSKRKAELAEERAEMAIEVQRRLKVMLNELEAEKTERGYVLTLGDILFDTDKTSLKPGANKTLNRLAEFLKAYPDRQLLIEGHADARGTEAYNLSLSEARAQAVKNALVARGIDPGRLEANGMGEAFPIATNDTTAGRQENRRVEVIVSDPEGEFPAAAFRTVSAY